MTIIKKPIISKQQTFAKVKAPHELNLEAICVFVAIGFFLDQDTYWKDTVVLRPASVHKIDDAGILISSTPWYNWHYKPRQLTFQEALDEFSILFELIIKEQTQGKKVILPLSGGLDSRTQATALKRLGTDVISYSYQFEQGYAETKIARQIAKACDFEFKSFTIPKGYLWNSLDTLTALNGCYSDFTSPRQMAMVDEFPKLGGDVFSLGHWGDVLFDSMNLSQLTLEEEVDELSKKLLKKGGLALATKLWNTWGLDGDFYDYFKGRIESLLVGIHIEDTNAKLRAFKSLYWAPRWTSVNLSVFESYAPVTLPYYDDRMCQLICSIPEAYLKNRQLQIAYIRTKTPELAKIPWQDQRPFNLNTYSLNKFPYHTPYKVYHKLKREFKAIIGKPYIQRNWELQFLGMDNQIQLKQSVEDLEFYKWVPKNTVDDIVKVFYNDPKPETAHSLNILLVLAKFNQSLNNG